MQNDEVQPEHAADGRQPSRRMFRPLERTVKIIVHVSLMLAFASLCHAAGDVRLSQEDDIREAVFRHQFDHNASSQQTSAKAYYLSVGENDADPTDEFMKRFASQKPPVRKFSASSTAKMRVVDRQTGMMGLVFRVRSIKWISDSEAVVKGGYYEGGLSASGNTYSVEKESGKWKVTKDKMDWIS